MSENSPLPWAVSDTVRETGHVKITGTGFIGLIASVGNGETAPDRYARDAALIVKAVNAHDALVAALEQAQRIVSDRVAGGRMLTSKEDASAVWNVCKAALALAKQPPHPQTETTITIEG